MGTKGTVTQWPLAIGDQGVVETSDLGDIRRGDHGDQRGRGHKERASRGTPPHHPHPRTRGLLGEGPGDTGTRGHEKWGWWGRRCRGPREDGDQGTLEVGTTGAGDPGDPETEDQGDPQGRGPGGQSPSHCK